MNEFDQFDWPADQVQSSIDEFNSHEIRRLDLKGQNFMPPGEHGSRVCDRLNRVIFAEETVVLDTEEGVLKICRGDRVELMIRIGEFEPAGRIQNDDEFCLVLKTNDGCAEIYLQADKDPG